MLVPVHTHAQARTHTHTHTHAHTHSHTHIHTHTYTHTYTHPYTQAMCQQHEVNCCVVGVPKSIDNDILLIDK